MQERLALQLARKVYPRGRLADNWRKDALCQRPDVNKDYFFSQHYGERLRARKICRVCPARFSCLVFALSMPFNPVGVWGGLTDRERTRLYGKNMSGRCRACGQFFQQPEGGTAVYCDNCFKPTQRPEQKTEWRR